VKLFAPASGAAVVVLGPLVVTVEGIAGGGVVVAAPVVAAGAIVDVGGVAGDGGVVVWARMGPAHTVLSRRAAEKILFI
jgi:hypothetical protein